MLFVLYNGSNQCGIFAGQGAGGNQTRIYCLDELNAAIVDVTPAQTYESQQWNFFAFQRDGNTGHVWLNNANYLNFSSTKKFDMTTSVIAIGGGKGFGGVKDFNGTFDEFRILNVNTSEAYIRAVYISQKSYFNAISIENTAPTLASLSMSPPQVWGNTTVVTASVKYTDPESDTGATTIQAYKNAILVANVTNSSVASGTNITATFTFGWVAGDNLSFRANGTDGTVNSNVVSIGNQSVLFNNPISRNPSISPPQIWLNTTTVTGSGVYENIDLFTGGFTLQWYYDAINVQNCTSSSVSNGTNVTCAYTGAKVHGHNISLSVNASSSGRNSVAASTGNLTISFNTPVITTGALSPSVIFANGTFNASGVYDNVDLDSGGWTCKYYKNGVNVENVTVSNVANGTNMTCISSFAKVAGDNISVSINSSSNGLASNVFSTGNITESALYSKASINQSWLKPTNN